ncbi:ribonuclease III [Leptolyngbya sp. BL0902]|uniref:ribonuclease III n=1 Tax=Leptolyngbya sp. BL0902 TaxID=1115757 RepID=UPI001CED6AC7|nr:ribonuclease III [Leptolyngbya sp. BL0902]
MPSHSLQRCLQKLGLPADLTVNWERLDLALTHESAHATENYEQLELLGDAVLRLAATECLQECFPGASVGELSALRSQLISDRTLAQLATRLGLDAYLMTDPSLKSRGVPTQRLADALEAVVAVVYLETHDLRRIRPWLDPHFQRLAQQLKTDPSRQNYKDLLQQITQKRHRALPQYRITEPGRDGDPQRYRAEVWFQERCLGTGHGPTKKQAEQAAAALGYEALTAAEPQDPAPSKSRSAKGSRHAKG